MKFMKINNNLNGHNEIIIIIVIIIHVNMLITSHLINFIDDSTISLSSS